MKKNKLIIMLLFCIISTVTRAQTWVSIDNTYTSMQKPKIEVLVSDATQYKFQMTIYGYSKNTVYENNTPYEQISIDNWMPLGKVGEPAIPMFTQFIGLPANSICTVAISDTEWVTMSVGKIYPAQEAREESDTTEYSFTINDSLYNAAEYEIEEYFIGEDACVGGMHGIPLSVIPFKYYPNRNEIEVLKSCIVTVSFSESSVINGNLSIKNKKLVESIVDNCNPDLLNTYNIPAADSINGNIYDYLIITTDQYKNTDALKEFCVWKRIKGHNCKIVSREEIKAIYNNSSTNSIKKIIKRWYEKGVKYVLFVGNNDDIPTKIWKYEIGTIESRPSDYWYACLNSEYIADIAIGRFCIKDSIELSNMVSKTISYENYTENDRWVTKNLLVAHKDSAPDNYQGCSEEIRTTIYNDAPQFTTAYGAHDSVGGNNATNDMVVSCINEGVGIVNYRGHGIKKAWKNDWSNEGIAFDISSIMKIKTKLYPLIFSIACSTGDFTRLGISNCLLHDFVKGEFGAVAFCGATRLMLTDAAHYLNKYLYLMLYSYGIYELAELNNAAQIKNILTYPYKNMKSSAIANAIQFICGGDPSLEIWTDTISKFPDIDVSLENGILNIDTRTIENYTLTLFSETDSSYFKKIIVEGKTVSITDVPASFVMSLNKHNYMPLVYNINDGDIYVQNENYALVRKLVGNNIYIGSDVTSTKSQGNVVVKSGAELSIDAKGKTVINNGFKVEQGSKILIK